MIGGAILLMIAIGFLYKKNLLVPGALLAATFPASSVLNVSGGGDFSIAPFWVVALAVVVHFTLSVYPRTARYGGEGLGKIQFLLLISFFWVIVVSLIAPLVFEGFQVFSPRIGIDLQVDNLSNLSFSISNIAQSFYAILLLAFTLYFVRSRVDSLKWLKIAFTIAVFFGLYQIAHDRFGIPFPDAVIYNNQGVTIANNQRIGTFLRINSTFVEPSLAGAFFAAGAAAMLSSRAFGMAAVCIVGVLLSTSSAGYLALFVSLAALLSYKAYWYLRRHTVAVRFIVVGVVTLFGALIAVQGFGLGDAILESTLRKGGTLSFKNRTASDLYSLDLLLQTFGLGVGLGSNRPSSFFTFMLSNTGIVGTLLFTLCFLLALLRKTAPWARWGLGTYLVAKVIGIPDFSDPWLWIWFSLALSVPAGMAAHSPASLRDEQRNQRHLALPLKINSMVRRTPES